MARGYILVLGNRADSRFKKFIIDYDLPEDTYEVCVCDAATWASELPATAGNKPLRLVTKTKIKNLDKNELLARLRFNLNVEAILLPDDSWRILGVEPYRGTSSLGADKIPQAVLRCLAKQDPDTKVACYLCHF